MKVPYFLKFLKAKQSNTNTPGEIETSEAEQVSESLAIPKGPKKVDCPEDNDFLSALDKMVSENIQERMREPVKSGNVDISVPVVMKSNAKKSYDQLQVILRSQL